MAAAIALTACNKQIEDIKPLTKIDQQGQLASVAGILQTTVGNYKMLTAGSSGYYYDLSIHTLGETRGDNVTLADWGTPTQYTDAFFFQNSTGVTSGQSATFYRDSYQLLVSVNLTLEGIDAFKKSSFASLTDADKNKVSYTEGENRFLRALTYFNLVRVYGKPYYQAGSQDLAIPLKTSSSISDVPAPSTVKDIYSFVTKELQAAAQLMKAPVMKSNAFASTAAAWALLSRVYLYMGGSITNPDQVSNQLAITYADSAINQTGGAYALLQGSQYKNMFGDDELGTLGRSAFASNKEIIFAYDNSNGGSAIGYLYHYFANYGFGGVFLPSSELLSLYATGDVRGTFFKVNAASGHTETTKWLCLPNGGVVRNPTIYLRLGEVYLNRAEAYAKTGNFASARSDLKAIHERAGLPPSDVDALADAQVLDAVLLERRLELAFEGHNSFDPFRNGLAMSRIPADFNGTAFSIEPTDPKVVFTLPTN